MVKSHTIKLYPTNAQKVLFKKSCGVARFAYNWALNKWQENYQNGIKTSAYSLVKHLNSIKKTEFPWMQETSKTCSQYAIHNVEKAYKNMWKKIAGYPKFKKKGSRDSFLAAEKEKDFKQDGLKIRLPRIGWVKCAESLRFSGKVNNVSVKRIADMWFAVVNIEVNPIDTPSVVENQATVGVDMGVKCLIVLSDGTIFENPKSFTSNLKKLKKRQRRFTKKKPGSNNRAKAQIKLARLHYRISCIRKTAIHKATSYIVANYGKIVIEDLNVAGMNKNKVMSKSLADVSFGEVSRQLAYKAQWSGKELVTANMWFPSSKICSNCGHKKERLRLSERTYECIECGLNIDRDLNAAKNLAKYSPTSKVEESKACGERNSVVSVQCSLSLNQEIDLITFKNYNLGQ